jgi:hypothetical protein
VINILEVDIQKRLCFAVFVLISNWNRIELFGSEVKCLHCPAAVTGTKAQKNHWVEKSAWEGE